jgi:hypothetical protein
MYFIFTNNYSQKNKNLKIGINERSPENNDHMICHHKNVFACDSTTARAVNYYSIFEPTTFISVFITPKYNYTSNIFSFPPQTPTNVVYYPGNWLCILSDRYPLYDIKTIKKFKLSISNDYISGVCRIGRTDILDWLLNINKDFKYDEHALTWASYNGHINVLDWWVNNNLPLLYTEYCLDGASRSGHINVLNWWKNSGLELKYTERALNEASQNGHIHVLDWWKNSGLPLKYSVQSLNCASMKGHVNVLDWWKNNNYELKFSIYAIIHASNYGHINVLNWWKDSKINLQYNEDVILGAFSDERIDVLDWWVNSNLPIKYPENIFDIVLDKVNVRILKWLFDNQTKFANSFLDLKKFHQMLRWFNSSDLLDLLKNARKNGILLKSNSSYFEFLYESDPKETVLILEWFKENGYELRYSESVFRNASITGCVDVLEWWKNSGFEIKDKYLYSLDEASSNGHINVLNWIKNSGLFIKYSHKALLNASIKGHIHVLTWWKNSGLKLKYDKTFLSILQKSLVNDCYYKSDVIDWWKNSGLL